MGMLVLDTSPINDWLDDADVDDFSMVTPTIGGGIHAILAEKVIVGMKGSAFYSEGGGDYLEATLSGGYGYFEVGYLVINQRRWMLAPVIGIGGGGLSMALKGDLDRFGVMSAPTGTTNPRGEETLISQKGRLGWGYGLAQVGLTFHHVVPFTDTPNGYGMVMFGASVGGLVQLASSSWEDDEMINSGSYPKPKFNGIYAQFEINFGGGATKSFKPISKAEKLDKAGQPVLTPEPEPKAESKTEPEKKPEAKPEAKPENKPDENRPAGPTTEKKPAPEPPRD